MKLIFFLVVFIVVLGACSKNPSTNQNSAAVVPQSNAEFREGMNHGAIFASVIVGRTLCAEMKLTRDQCLETETDMSALVIQKISAMPDETIDAMVKKDPSFKAAMKEGASLFSVTIGQILCDSLRASKQKCLGLRTAIKEATDEMINRLSDKDVERLRANPKSEEIFV